MLKTPSLESLLSRNPATGRLVPDAKNARIKEAVDRTRTRITHAFEGATKVQAKVKQS